MRMRANGEGRIYRPYYRDKLTGERRQSATWWIQYQDPRRPRDKQQVRESAKSEKKTEAVKLLQQRLDDINKGRPTGPDVQKTTIGDMRQMVVDHFIVNKRRSLKRLRGALRHLVGQR